MADLAIKLTQQGGGYLDLFDNEKVVQSFSLIDIEDVTKFTSEYSNNFKVPKTNGNVQKLGFADFINSTTLIPYSKNPCEIYIGGFLFKKGIIEVESIDEDINVRFYTGNINFYNIIKERMLTEVSTSNTPSLITTWNLFNVVNGRNATSGAFFPLIDYNGMATSGNQVDVRLLLPAYYRKTLMEAICVDAGYTLVNSMGADAATAYDKDIIPTAKNNLENSSDVIDFNSYEGSIVSGTNDVLPVVTSGSGVIGVSGGSVSTVHVTLNAGNTYLPHGFSTHVSGNPNLYNPNTKKFTAAISGSYDINYDFDLDLVFSISWSSLPAYTAALYTAVYVQVNNTQTLIHNSSYGTTDANPGGVTTATESFSGTHTVYLNAGDTVQIVSRQNIILDTGAFNGQISYNMSCSISTIADFVECLLTNTMTFGSQIDPGLCLPEIKQSDFFKDTLIRYGIIPDIDEDAKTITLKSFNDIKTNIVNALDWSDKHDETKDDIIQFALNSYAQKNFYNHKEDETVSNTPIGTNGVLAIGNQNLEFEKVFYTSPFAASETVERLGTDKVMFIDLHDGTGFNNNVQPRTGYVRLINRTIDYWDGTTTTTVTTNIPLTWFVDAARDYSAGFANNCLQYSKELFDVLQALKIVRADIRLNLIDILNLDFLIPVYLSKYNSYFFLSKIDQFDYTSNESTEVQLIKLN